MDVVDEVFNGFIIFCGVIWTPLGEDGVFDLGDVAIETRFLRGVVIPISISSLGLVGTSPSLLIHLFFVTQENTGRMAYDPMYEPTDGNLFKVVGRYLD